MAVFSVTPEHPLLWAFLMENFNLGIAKMSVLPAILRFMIMMVMVMVMVVWVRFLAIPKFLTM